MKRLLTVLNGIPPEALLFDYDIPEQIGIAGYLPVNAYLELVGRLLALPNLFCVGIVIQ